MADEPFAFVSGEPIPAEGGDGVGIWRPQVESWGELILSNEQEGPEDPSPFEGEVSSQVVYNGLALSEDGDTAFVAGSKYYYGDSDSFQDIEKPIRVLSFDVSDPTNITQLDRVDGYHSEFNDTLYAVSTVVGGVFTVNVFGYGMHVDVSDPSSMEVLGWSEPVFLPVAKVGDALYDPDLRRTAASNVLSISGGSYGSGNVVPRVNPTYGYAFGWQGVAEDPEGGPYLYGVQDDFQAIAFAVLRGGEPIPAGFTSIPRELQWVSHNNRAARPLQGSYISKDSYDGEDYKVRYFMLKTSG